MCKGSINESENTKQKMGWNEQGVVRRKPRGLGRGRSEFGWRRERSTAKDNKTWTKRWAPISNS